MRKKILTLVFVCLLATPLMAAAETARPAVTGSKASGTPVTSSALKGAVKGVVARCPIIESKIQAKVTNFDNTKIKHLSVYNSLKTKLAALADKLAAQGVDVAALRADLIVLDTKLAKFSADYAIYVAKLKASQVSVCGKAEGQFRTQLKDAKTALQQVNKDVVDIRTYFNTVIKQEVNRIRQILNPRATSTPTTVTSTKSTRTVPLKPIVPPLPKLD